MSTVFISHSRTDEGLYDALKSALLEFGHEVVGFDSLAPGTNLSKELNRLLHSC